MLSSSQDSSSSQPHPLTRPHLSARRRLSTSFSSVQFSSLPTAIAEGEIPADQDDRHSRTPSRDFSPEDSVDGDSVTGEGGDPLQRSSTSDNVFTDSESLAANSLTFQHQYPSNRHGMQAELGDYHTSIAINNMSPQVSKLRPHSNRPNPLISHTNISRGRSQSAVFTGRGDHPFPLAVNGSPLSRRRATLALIGRSHQGGSGHQSFFGLGSMSPLTSGHKSRTPSGKYECVYS